MSEMLTEAEVERAAIRAIEPMPEEQESYYTQDYAERVLIDAMASIGQTYARAGHYGPNGDHELVVIRTDRIGVVRRGVVTALMWMIGRLAPGPEPINRTEPHDNGHRPLHMPVEPAGEAACEACGARHAPSQNTLCNQ